MRPEARLCAAFRQLSLVGQATVLASVEALLAAEADAQALCPKSTGRCVGRAADGRCLWCLRQVDEPEPGDEAEAVELVVGLEPAVETVVSWLEENGHSELARAVAVVTDPEPEARQTAADELRRMMEVTP